MIVKKAHKILKIILICLLLGVGAICCICWNILIGVNEWSATAQTAHPHPGDDIAALIEYVRSPSHTLHDRNLAVWALGQSRDRRALPVLKTFQIRDECDHNNKLCQYELRKAVELLGKSG